MTHPRPTVGRTVFFVLHEGPNAGQIRSAVITRVWRQADDKSPVRDAEIVQLTVNLDGSNDVPINESENTYATHLAVSSAHYESAGTTPRTWHWPPRD